MRVRLIKASLVAAVVAVPVWAGVAEAADIVRANNNAYLFNQSAWAGGIIPGVNDVAVWSSASRPGITPTGSNLAGFGGIRVTNPAGLAGIEGNTIIVGRFGLDMSAATQDFTFNNFRGADGVSSNVNVADGRALLLTGAFTGGVRGSLNFNPVNTATVTITAGTLSTSSAMGPGFVYRNGSDFAALDASRRVVGLSNFLTYTPNPGLLSTASSPYGMIAVTNSLGTAAATGTALTLPSAAASNISLNQGLIFNTPHSSGLDWTVDFAGTANTITGGFANGILVSSAVTSRVVFQNQTAAAGTKGLNPTGALFYVRNYSASDLVLGVNATGPASSVMVKSGPGKVVQSGTSSFSGGTVIQEGIWEIVPGGRLSGGSLNVNGGSLIINSLNAPLSQVLANSGGRVSGSGNALAGLTVSPTGSFGSVSPGNNGVGTLTFTGVNFAVAGNTSNIATGNFELAAGGPSDLLVATLTAAFNPGTRFNLFTPGTTNAFTTSGTYTLVRSSGAMTGSANVVLANPQVGSTYAIASVAGAGTTTELRVTINTTAPNNWNLTTGGSWGPAASWTGTSAPGGALAFASFGSSAGAAPAGPSNITLDGDQTVGVVRFEGTNAYTVSQGSGGTLTFTNTDGVTSSPAYAVAASGDHTISAPVVIGTTGLNASAAAGGSLTFSGPVSGGALTVGGGGAVVVAGSFSGAAALIASGTLRLADGGSLGSTAVSLSPGAVLELARSDSFTFANNVTGLTANPVAPVASANATLRMAGTGTVTLSGTNLLGTNAGAGLFITSGKVVLGSSAALNSNAFVGVSGGTLDLAGQNVTIDLSGTGGTVRDDSASPGTTTLTINALIDSTFAGNIVETPTRKISLVKASAVAGQAVNVNASPGITTLSGDVLITGDISVTGGGLVFTKPLNTGAALTVTSNPPGINLGSSATFAPAPSAGTNVRAAEFSSITIGSTGQTMVSSVVLAPVDRATFRPTVLVASSLSIPTASSPALSGFLDLGNGDLVLKGGAASEAAIRSYVKAWIDSGTTKVGLGAGSATALTTLAVFSNDSGFGFAETASFSGVSVNAADLLVKFTYLGDTNIDGIVDARDVNKVLSGWTNGLTGWKNGDTNYDGLVDGTDYLNVLAALAGQGAPLDGTPSGASAIPEPAAAGFLAAGLPLLARRRGRTAR